MERTIFLQHYRVCLKSDGSPREISRDGAATTYEAVDERSRESVDLKLIPLESIAPDARGRLEEQARAAQQLRHVNIAKVFDFGREGGDLVCISEHLPGETLAAWVAAHGPMPADAVLRVAEQIVSVLSSASFHKLPFPSIQPSDIIVVPGQTPEGTWPLVKLINFGLPALRSSPELQSEDSRTAEQSSAAQFVSSEQSADKMKDIRSEIYSLGATLYFLLTGVALSADAVQRAPKLSRFPKPLRNLLARMLNRDPDQRSKDLVVLAETVRECLVKIERRRAFADKYGIPYRTTIPRRSEARPARLWRIAVPVAVLLLTAAVIIGVLLAEPIGRIVHRNHEAKNIGVLVGVPESSPPAAASQKVPTTRTPATVASQGSNAAVPFPAQSQTNAATVSNSSQAAPPDIQQTQTMNPQPQATAPTVSEAASPAAVAENPVSSTDETKPSSKSDETAQPSTSSQSSSHGKKKSVASNSRRARAGQTAPEDSTQRDSRSVRARVVGITPDGRLILRLPSGRTAFVAPDGERDEFAPRRHRRAMIDRDDTFAPQPRFEPDYFPND